ncbi:Hypp4965 [Branchiostoma lanceolatum]|uniref:Hypp4965 protein n=1 Tax=Branchiostoma lanceolatum TaxID=7740 RepID=A0A8K0AFA6_BRALA|nr:Hypp4965 [Branchiostoma lanceolatum]
MLSSDPPCAERVRSGCCRLQVQQVPSALFRVPTCSRGSSPGPSPDIAPTASRTDMPAALRGTRAAPRRPAEPRTPGN